ncbi:MAG: archaemetzincin family Zn-dependent metalloprotease [Pyrodictiaceae archaeon]
MRNPLSIIIQPVGGVELDSIDWLSRNLARRMPLGVEVLPVSWRLTPPLSLFNFERMQYKASELIVWLYREYKDYLRAPRNFIVGIVEGDGYVEGLNFVFGVARSDIRVAVVFTKRLRAGNQNLFRERLLKETIHELGHLMGLGHCENRRCVMSFSNSIVEVDLKEASFCDKCRSRLIKLYGNPE